MVTNGACAIALIAPISVENSGSRASLLSSPSYTELGRLVSLTQMGDPLITIIFHHGGSFIAEADGSMSYNSGEIYSHDNNDSAQDEPYRPGGDKVSSEKDLLLDRSAAKTNVKLRSRTYKKLTKGKKAVMVEDDGPVCADSDSEDDEIIFRPIPKFGSSVNPYHDVQDDVYNDSDGGDSWHSEEMKTPPNSEDELEEVDSDDVFSTFRKGGRFGELRLEVGMTFTTKMEFKEAMREYCIQEGRRIWFKKNDNVRMKAVCKDESCGWLIETKNRLANRKWLACKLAKKLRKYPNLRHSEAAQSFKTKCDLDLNKSSLTRALGDARSVVYGDAAAQYGMVRDYGLTLLKSNLGSTVTVGVIPQPNPNDDPIFEKMYVCLDGCKKGFLAGCRPLIGLDGAFLKTRHGGQILSAIGQDANNHMYIIVYAIVPVENIENWR
nr:uncharacterized protein LOC112805880 [Arachis hypogaea]